LKDSRLLWRPFLMSFLLWTGAAAASAAEAVVRGLDHISVAVVNLEKARADYEALGFVIKPGRAHANGIRNDRVKFADGTEVELITAARSADALSSDYLDWLKSGDGPAYLGLFAPSLETLSKTLAGHDLSIEQGEGVWTLRRQPALKRVFFARRQHSPTDRPEHFAHPNTAFTLSGVWLAGAEAERDLVRMLGGVRLPGAACSHFGPAIEVQSLPEAMLVFLPATVQLASGRTIVGLTLSVRDLQTARRLLDKNGIQYVSNAHCPQPSVWIAPAAAHGVWLELRQAPF
jgi:Glyoxalase-like domain